MSEFFDKFKKVFVTIFPPIVMPQKRYIALGITVIYLVVKQIVTLTPTKADDELLEQIHHVAYQLIQNTQDNRDETAE